MVLNYYMKHEYEWDGVSESVESYTFLPGIFLGHDPSIDWFKYRSNIQWVVTNIPGSELKEGRDDFDRENDRIFMEFGEPKYKLEQGP